MSPPDDVLSAFAAAAWTSKLGASGLDGASYRLRLATQLLGSLEEEDPLEAESLLKLARRLANAVNRPDLEQWLTLELEGYPVEVPPELQPTLRRLGREVVRESLGGEDLIVPRVWLYSLHELETIVRRNLEEDRIFGQIARRVRSELHRWVAEEFHRLAFVDVAEATFSRYKAALHAALMEAAPEVAEKVPAVYERLRGAGADPEAVSSAMNTCRRMIVGLADAIYPASSTPVKDEAGVEHRVTTQQVLNRIEAFLATRCNASRRERLQRHCGCFTTR